MTAVELKLQTLLFVASLEQNKSKNLVHLIGEAQMVADFIFSKKKIDSVLDDNI